MKHFNHLNGGLPLFVHLILFTLLHFFIGGVPLPAQRSWDGGAGTNSWLDAANWNPDGLPTATEKAVIISGNVVLPAGADETVAAVHLCCAVKLTIAEGATLDVIASGSNSAISATHAGTTVINNGTLHISNGVPFSIGISGGAYFENNGTASLQNSGVYGAIEANFSNFNNNGDLIINGVSNRGDGIHIIGTTTVVNNMGTMTIINTDGDGVSGSGDFNNYGTIEISDVIFPTDYLVDGEEGLEFKNELGSMFMGDGQVEPVGFISNGGMVSFASPALLEFNCNTQACPGEDFSNAAIHFLIEGTAGPGLPNGHDKVVVNKNAHLGGTFQVEFGNGFEPSGPHTFVLMTYLTKTGSNPVFDLPPLPPNYSWNTNVGATSIELSLTSLLPVELVFFQAKQVGEQAELHWQTASETNNRGFSIERSLDGKGWLPIGFAEAKGQPNAGHDYFFMDGRPAISANYYRLRQEDLDGSWAYSKIVKLVLGGEGSRGPSIFPVPLQPGQDLHFNWPGAENEVINAIVFDALGRAVWSGEILPQAGKIALGKLSPGMYWLEMKSENAGTRKKFLVQG